MEIAGFVKNSMIDYPKHIACVVFTPGCNMNCFYCHNKHINIKGKRIPEEEVLDYIAQNKGFLEGVVVSGGEPTLQSDLYYFIKKIKRMGLKVKLDTNGTNVTIVKKLLKDKLLDFVAMDIKAPFDRYKEITRTDDDMKSVIALKNLLLKGVVDYEFRTTFVNSLYNEDMIKIAKNLKGAKALAIQKYRPCDSTGMMRDDSEQNWAAIAAEKFVRAVIKRGL